MAETLLRTNRRAASILCAFAASWVAVGIALLMGGIRAPSPIMTWTGAGIAMFGLCLLGRPLSLLIPPRLSVTPRHLRVYLRGFIPWRVPLEDVECFFIGQAPIPFRVEHPTGGRVESATVVVRLAERATRWRHRAVDAACGQWQDGYITILGTWCEPLDGDVVKRMNHRLVVLKRQQRACREENVTP